MAIRDKTKSKQRTRKNKPARLRLSRVVDTRIIYCGDNLDQLKKLPDRCVDLVYIDPPFHSNRNYEVFWGETGEHRSFEDRHASISAYLEFMRPRCIELARVLKTEGAFYYHCDWHAGHYIKVMLDEILGVNSFKSEVIWKRTHSHGNVGRNFGNVVDRVLFYVRSNRYTWNQLYQSFDESYVERTFRYRDPDGRRYQSVTLRNPSRRPNLHYPYTASNGVTYQPHPNGWSCDIERMKKYDREGRLHFPKKAGGALRLKMYLDESHGPKLQNLWDDIPPVASQARERIGYPTQKPLPLLERIIQTSSNPGDIVLDAFCGCGTALEAAENLGRQWIGIDISPTACHVMAKRIRDQCKLKESEEHWLNDVGFIVRDLPWDETRLRKLPPFEFENWAVIALKGVPNQSKVGDMGVDGRIYPLSSIDKNAKSKGAAGAQLEFTLDMYYPVQVKQKAKAGRPDIDAFEAAMMRLDSDRGYFVAFDYTRDAQQEIRRFKRQTGKEIIAVTVDEILEEEQQRRYA